MEYEISFLNKKSEKFIASLRNRAEGITCLELTITSIDPTLKCGQCLSYNTMVQFLFSHVYTVESTITVPTIN